MFFPVVCAIRGLGVSCSGGGVDAGPRAGRSPRESGAGRSPLQASPGARRARVCGRSVCWGSKGLRPVTSRPQHGKTAARWTRAPGDMSPRCLTCILPDPEPKISVLAAWQKGGVSIDFSSKATRSQLRCTHSDVGRLNASHVHHHREDPASRGPWSAYIACASKTRQPRIRDPRRLKPSSSRNARTTQPWVRAAKESPSSSVRRTRTS